MTTPTAGEKLLHYELVLKDIYTFTQKRPDEAQIQNIIKNIRAWGLAHDSSMNEGVTDADREITINAQFHNLRKRC